MNLAYCDILATWAVEGKRNIETIFSYKIAQSDFANDEDENGDESESSFDSSEGLLLLQDREDEINKPCVLYLTCKTPYNVSITGLEIVSESRTQELYDSTDTYITTTTAKGTHICSDETVLHRSKARCSKPLDKCSIKFLSLRGKREFCLHRVTVHLVQEKCEPPLQLHSGKIDLENVKELVNSMGGTMSDRAKSFMNTMEQYQQNQESTMADVESLLSRSSNQLQPGPGGMAGMMAMLSTMNKLSAAQLPAQSDTSTPLNDTINHPVTPGQLIKGESDSTGENPAQVFSFLKSICGEVSKMRGMENDLKTTSNKSTTENIEEDSEKKVDHVGPVSGEYLSALEQRLTLHMDRAEQKLQRYMESRMNKLERRINRKLDALIDLLTQALQGQGSIESSDESSSSAEGLDLD